MSNRQSEVAKMRLKIKIWNRTITGEPENVVAQLAARDHEKSFTPAEYMRRVEGRYWSVYMRPLPDMGVGSSGDVYLDFIFKLREAGIIDEIDFLI